MSEYSEVLPKGTEVTIKDDYSSDNSWDHCLIEQYKSDKRVGLICYISIGKKYLVKFSDVIMLVLPPNAVQTNK